MLDQCTGTGEECIYHYESNTDDLDDENYGIGDSSCATLTSTNTYRYRLTCFLEQEGAFLFRLYYWGEDQGGTDHINIGNLVYETGELTDPACQELPFDADGDTSSGHQGTCADVIISNNPPSWISGTPHFVITAIP